MFQIPNNIFIWNSVFIIPTQISNDSELLTFALPERSSDPLAIHDERFCFSGENKPLNSRNIETLSDHLHIA